ncbi:PAS domain-containing protein [Azospirillum sp. RWY-5-1]|uniref:DNA-directed DNA polymerase n=1 Tax=Azospirillum oleiclasticum TaxID=2735135 RepID=A0ABX2TDJ3_9PROT|nr:exonuclease domain-containing protein [Azospirillum oleiclasticum]NYZ14775.1 PAS domain-containing protein [Azospirillum oleiclasticum]NYZ22239.1 PAS domain-containing protein [Azospirillum oleiclasticum]
MTLPATGESAGVPAPQAAAPAPAAPRRVVPLAFLGAGGFLVLAAGGLAVWLKGGGSADPLTSFAILMVMAVAAALGGLWLVVDRRLLRAGATLASEARVVGHGSGGARIPAERYGDMAAVALAVNDLAEKLVAARRDIDRTVAHQTTAVEEQKTRLAAILRDLHEGVLVCNAQHQILLYNQTAVDLLQLSGTLGLGRSLLHFLAAEPVIHTLERLTLRVREGRHLHHEHGTTAQFIGGTKDGGVLLEGRMSVILQEPGGTEEGPPVITGYVITLADATRELAALGQRDALLREATESFRSPIANLRAVVETMADSPDLGADDRAAFEAAMLESCNALSDKLERVAGEYRNIITGSWPMSDIHSANLINLVRHRVGSGRSYTVTPTGLPQWVHADSFSVVVLLDYLIEYVYALTAIGAYDLSATAEGRWVYLDIEWQGPPVPSGIVDSWLDHPLPDALGGLTVGDVLQHHRSTMWSEAIRGRDGFARLRVPLPPALSPPSAGKHKAAAAARPEFFDFNLLHQPLVTSELGRTPLDRLHYVVFDTETTGLAPSTGDEIIQIAAVRIVNGRILTGETFSTLVNPGRSIPAESVRFHGLTDAMVADAPDIRTVLPQFRAYVSGAVIVAHNAAFDLKFIKMKERAAGVRFDTPVLDTMLLSRMLQGDDGDHTLDGIAHRLGIEVVDRHTALGDSLVTAAIFLKMIDMLRERDVRTLDDAIRAANIIVELAQRERAF